MRKTVEFFLLALVFVFTANLQADEQHIRKALSRIMPSVQPDQISPSVIEGIYEVLVGAQVFYVTGDGKYIIQGSIYDVEQQKDISEEKIAQARINAIKAIGQDNMIVFSSKESKYTVTVFTDIDCGYCRKLHSEIDQYLDKGITIQYMFFPRAGKGSNSYKKAVSVWCSKDRQAALTQAKKGEAPEQKACDNPVDEHMALGRKLGASGTPMLVTEAGTILPGYIPADRLAKALKAEKSGLKIR